MLELGIFPFLRSKFWPVYLHPTVISIVGSVVRGTVSTYYTCRPNFCSVFAMIVLTHCGIMGCMIYALFLHHITCEASRDMWAFFIGLQSRLGMAIIIWIEQNPGQVGWSVFRTITTVTCEKSISDGTWCDVLGILVVVRCKWCGGHHTHDKQTHLGCRGIRSRRPHGRPMTGGGHTRWWESLDWVGPRLKTTLIYRWREAGLGGLKTEPPRRLIYGGF